MSTASARSPSGPALAKASSAQAGTLAPQVRVPREVRTVFLASVPALVATWSLGGLYLSLGSSVVSRVFGVGNHGAAGAILFVFFACAAVTSLFITDRSSTIKAAYGFPALAAGVVIQAQYSPKPRSNERYRITPMGRTSSTSSDAVMVVYLLNERDEVVQNLHRGGKGEGSYLIEMPGRYHVQVNATGHWKIRVRRGR